MGLHMELHMKLHILQQQQSDLGRYDILQPIYYRIYITADILRQMYYGRYDGRHITAYILRQIYYSRYTTADILGQIYYRPQKRPYLQNVTPPEALDRCIRILLLQHIFLAIAIWSSIWHHVSEKNPSENRFKTRRPPA